MGIILRYWVIYRFLGVFIGSRGVGCWIQVSGFRVCWFKSDRSLDSHNRQTLLTCMLFPALHRISLSPTRCRLRGLGCFRVWVTSLGFGRMKNHIERMSSIEKNMEAGDIYMYTHVLLAGY